MLYLDGTVNTEREKIDHTTKIQYLSENWGLDDIMWGGTGGYWITMLCPIWIIWFMVVNSEFFTAGQCLRATAVFYALIS